MLQSFHHSGFHFHLWHSWCAEVREYYLFVTLWCMGNFGANILLPLYLLSLNFTLPQILFVYLINQFALISMLFLVSLLLKKWGLKRILGGGSMLYIIYLLLLGLVPLSHGFQASIPFLILLFTIRAFGKCFLNFGHEVFMIKIATKKSTSIVVGWVRICIIIASVLTPAIGAMVAYAFGYHAAFLFLAFCVFLSFIPLMLMPNHHFSMRHQAKGVFGLLKRKLHKKYLLAEIGRIFPDAILYFMWPMFLFSIVGNAKDVGLLTSLSALVAIGVARLVSKSLQHGKSNDRIFKGSIRLASCLYFIRAVFPTPILITIVDSLNKICESVIQVSYETRCYRYLKSLKQENPIELANIRLLILELLYVLALIFIFVITTLMQSSGLIMFIVLFAAASPLLLLMALIPPAHRFTQEPSAIIEGQP